MRLPRQEYWSRLPFPSPGYTQYPKLLLSIYLFPGSSAGKESSCNAGDPGSIPGSGRSPREGMGYPFQYSWASVVAQMVKNLPTVKETWLQSLGWEDPLEKRTATHSSILAWRISWTVSSMGCDFPVRSAGSLQAWSPDIFI